MPFSLLTSPNSAYPRHCHHCAVLLRVRCSCQLWGGEYRYKRGGGSCCCPCVNSLASSSSSIKPPQCSVSSMMVAPVDSKGAPFQVTLLPRSISLQIKAFQKALLDARTARLVAASVAGLPGPGPGPGVGGNDAKRRRAALPGALDEETLLLLWTVAEMEDEASSFRPFFRSLPLQHGLQTGPGPTCVCLSVLTCAMLSRKNLPWRLSSFARGSWSRLFLLQQMTLGKSFCGFFGLRTGPGPISPEDDSLPTSKHPWLWASMIPPVKKLQGLISFAPLSFFCTQAGLSFGQRAMEALEGTLLGPELENAQQVGVS